MEYRKDKKGNDISLLGYGCMRFSRKAGIIDLDKAEKEVMEAISTGVNYFDTAYIYPGSESALGEILSRNNCRDKVKIATKLPYYMIKSMEGVEKIFQEELKRLKTDTIDYYLMHMLSDVPTWERLKAMGIEEWISEKLSLGQIQNIGFSFHGTADMFKKLVDIYDWDFCQIQYNYMDEHSQAGVSGLKYATEKGIPVIVMEPLRGGSLVSLLPSSAKKIISTYSDITPASLAFKWLYNQPEVISVLSGMNSLDMVKENVKTASESPAGCMTQAHKMLIEQVISEIRKTIKVGCTGCGYCLPCPVNVDIPGTFLSYNNIYSENKRSAQHEYLRCTALRKSSTSASQCIQCGKCETHCPQQIEIRKELKNAEKELENIPYKVIKFFIKILRLF